WGTVAYTVRSRRLAITMNSTRSRRSASAFPSPPRFFAGGAVRGNCVPQREQRFCLGLAGAPQEGQRRALDFEVTNNVRLSVQHRLNNANGNEGFCRPACRLRKYDGLAGAYYGDSVRAKELPCTSSNS